MAKSDKRVRYAVVGVGNIAQVAALPAFEHASENSDLVALISGDPVKLDEVGPKYNIEASGSYDDFEETCRRARVDAIYLATPNTTHRELTERAARAGIHVLCEKPMAVSVQDCEAMAQACEAHKVKLMIAYRLHFDQANLGAIEVVQTGDIGDVKAFSSCFAHQVRPDNIRARPDLGGGALYDLGIYCLNAARCIFRAEPIEVVGYQAHDDRFPGVDVSTFAMLRFSDDCVAQLACSQGLADVSRYQVMGTKGDLVLDPAYGYAVELRRILTIDGRSTQKTYGKHDQFAPELVYFSNCILDNQDPEPSAEEGVADVRVLEAIITSARSGKPVGLGTFQRRRYPGVDLRREKPPVEKPETVHAPSPHL